MSNTNVDRSTRRMVLQSALGLAAEQGWSVKDVHDRVVAFKANGGTGIEPFINGLLDELVSTGDPCDGQTEALVSLQAELTALAGKVSAAIAA